MKGSVWLSQEGVPELAMDEIPLDANDLHALFRRVSKSKKFFMGAHVSSICFIHTQHRSDSPVRQVCSKFRKSLDRVGINL
jgi:hypothetical protein